MPEKDDFAKRAGAVGLKRAANRLCEEAVGKAWRSQADEETGGISMMLVRSVPSEAAEAITPKSGRPGI